MPNSIGNEVNPMQRHPFGKWASTCAVGLIVASASVALSEPESAMKLPGNPVHGKTLYQGCAACHSIDENDIGPRHRGVVGRHAGSIEDYSYSAALKNSGLIWSEATLDRWLTNPSTLVPGTKMFFKIDDSQSRADIIAYLEEQK
jgi:cytochrome c